MHIPTTIAAASKALAGLTAIAILLAPSSGSLWAATSCTVSDPTGTPLNVRNRPGGQIVSALHNGVTVLVSDLAVDGDGRKWAKIVTLPEGKAGWVFREYLTCENGGRRGGSGKNVPMVCSGTLWNIHADQNKETWIEIGHGIYQCSVKNAAGEAGKKILSVCNLGNRCTVRVEIVPKHREEDHDTVVVTDDDIVLSVRPGAKDDSGYEGAKAHF